MSVQDGPRRRGTIATSPRTTVRGRFGAEESRPPRPRRGMRTLRRRRFQLVLAGVVLLVVAHPLLRAAPPAVPDGGVRAVPGAEAPGGARAEEGRRARKVRRRDGEAEGRPRRGAGAG